MNSEYLNVTSLIIGFTVITSLLAFSNHKIIDSFIFWPYRIWRSNEWYRVITGGLIHRDLVHLFFNMYAFYGFGLFVESAFVSMLGPIGHAVFGAMYVLAVIAADIYNLFKRKDDYQYRALGASGGVSAIVFAFILLKPFGGIGLIFIPGVYIPAFIFGGLYLFYCSYMAKQGGDSVDHQAHFWGSVFGFIFPLFFAPQLILHFITQILTWGGN